MSGFSWGEVFVMAISGGLVAWIPFGITQWQSHRTLKAHIDDVTAAQTGTIIHLTDDQTAQLTGELLAGRAVPDRAVPPAGEYHGHDHIDGLEGRGPGVEPES